jgi:phosphoglycerate transport regulatory protein PgtC
MKRTFWNLSLIGLAAFQLASPAVAADIVVLTTFSKEVTEVYRKAYEVKYPGDRVQIVSMSTTKLLPYLRDPGNAARPDVVWASDPGAFVALANAKLLQAAPAVRNTGIPKTGQTICISARHCQATA